MIQCLCPAVNQFYHPACHIPGWFLQVCPCRKIKISFARPHKAASEPQPASFGDSHGISEWCPMRDCQGPFHYLLAEKDYCRCCQHIAGNGWDKGGFSNYVSLDSIRGFVRTSLPACLVAPSHCWIYSFVCGDHVWFFAVIFQCHICHDAWYPRRIGTYRLAWIFSIMGTCLCALRERWCRMVEVLSGDSHGHGCAHHLDRQDGTVWKSFLQLISTSVEWRFLKNQTGTSCFRLKQHNCRHNSSDTSCCSGHHDNTAGRFIAILSKSMFISSCPKDLYPGCCVIRISSIVVWFWSKWCNTCRQMWSPFVFHRYEICVYTKYIHLDF